MSVISDSIAAATAVVGYDLLTDNRQQVLPYPRVILGLKLTGSAAAGDTKVELWVGERRIGEYFNTNTGYGNADDIQPVNTPVPPGTPIHLIVVDAPNTNPINFVLYMAP